MYLWTIQWISFLKIKLYNLNYKVLDTWATNKLYVELEETSKLLLFWDQSQYIENVCCKWCKISIFVRRDFNRFYDFISFFYCSLTQKLVPIIHNYIPNVLTKLVVRILNSLFPENISKSDRISIELMTTT